MQITVKTAFKNRNLDVLPFIYYAKKDEKRTKILGDI